MMTFKINRVVLLILDSVGCGDAPDAEAYSDTGSNTLGNMAKAIDGLNLPNLGRMGLGNLADIIGVPPVEYATGAYGRLTEVSAGKDTTTGHWELAGVILDHPFPVYPNGFPGWMISQFEQLIGRRTLGNFPASGTEIIKALGDEHLRTGYPIIYTSADSVFQIAAHEELIPIDTLYTMCEVAREMLTGEHAVGRVIARPFIGQPGNFVRTERRKDYSLIPPSDTILDILKANDLEVIGVGKIDDIFANRGLTSSNHSGNNMDGIDAILNYLAAENSGLIFANLVDFDALYGHRNDPRGYADALEAFDWRLPEILTTLHSNDVLIITADHGNDPTTPSTDHSRERVPILIHGRPIAPNLNIGTRKSFADVAATIADFLGIKWEGPGLSLATDILT